MQTLRSKGTRRRDQVSPPVGHNRTHIEQVRLSKLIRRPDDPQRNSKRDIDIAAAALRRLPEGCPPLVIVNARHQVMVGHIIVEAARKLSLDWLMVLVHEGLTELEEKHYTVAINQLLGRGGWDAADLESWVREFEAGIENFDHTLIGFDNGELDRFLGISSKLVGGDADEVPPMFPHAVSRLGMVWALGRHRIMVGDATNVKHLEQLMAGQCAKLTITDPPFGCVVDGFVSKKGKHRNFVQAAGEMSPDELEAMFNSFANNLSKVMVKGALVYVFIDWRSLHLMLRACEQVFGPLVQLCCWTKDRAGMGSFYRSQHELVLVFRVPGAGHANNVQLGRNGRNRSNVWEYPSAASSRSGREGDMLKLHPTPKTVEMIADAILDSTEHGDTVIDCFLGSGTALIAAERTGRLCYGMDLDPLYVDVAVRRWQAWTGEIAVDAESGRTFDDIAAERTQDGEHRYD